MTINCSKCRRPLGAVECAACAQPVEILAPLLAADPTEHALLLDLAGEATRLRQELLASRDWPQWTRFCAALDALAAFREAR